VTQITIPLEDILTDPENPIDLTALPTDEAIQHLTEIYSFLPPESDISITDDLVTLTIPEQDDYRAREALRTYERAVRYAERGKYDRAIRLFREALDVLPAHVDARRNLAMALMETGDAEATKQVLVDLLRLQPDDAWAFLILGNAYAQFDDDLESAERFYRAAYELNPDDVYLLNSYAALKARQGHFDDARHLFQSAIDKDPDSPNPRYGLALLNHRQGHSEQALSALQRLFERPHSRDRRSEPVYEQARALYVQVNRIVAEDNHAEMLARLEDVFEDYAAETSYPIELQQDDSLKLPATTKLAWVYERAHHVIKYSPTAPPAILPHLIAHEFEHIRLAYEAREAGRGKVFVSTDQITQNVLNSSSRSQRELRRRGIGDDAIADFMHQITTGLTSQLLNAPLDMVIEHRVYHRHPYLRPNQVVSLHATQLENVQALTSETLPDTVPPRIYHSNVAMNCAYALFTDHLLNGATAYADPYRKSHIFPIGRQLFQAWQEAMAHFEPGDEYDLVDQFAEILDLEDWYEWRSGNGASRRSDTATLPGITGPTNVELLEQRQPAVVMYLLGALQRFEDMEHDDILQVTAEIALMGRFGLDYSSTDSQYTLRSLPGEQFSGLQLMCLMYVGMKRVHPSADSGIPFDDAYAMALSMYQSDD